MRKNHSILGLKAFLFMLIIGTVFLSCNKDEIITTDPEVKLSFSADTVVFDTVFSTIGSTTRYLMVYNTDRNRVKISSVRLAGGNDSPYQLNIDGVPATQLNDIEIPGEDSLYVFIRVTVNPNDENNPSSSAIPLFLRPMVMYRISTLLRTDKMPIFIPMRSIRCMVYGRTTGRTWCMASSL